MAVTIKPGKYLIDRSRRMFRGALARVGTGGSVPGPAQTALDGYIASLKAQGSDPKMERETIRSGMKRLAGSWMLLSPSGLRWVYAEGSAEKTKKAIQTALRSSGWTVPAAQLDELLEEKG